ncbi:hypothetical protein E4U43_004540 [Claviceps pusilla]|uniref:Uncharacterized protein n=1 Tax=Claviceps pusilla TaxID=123648 RepID=A0A9P7NF17_9HYPO|nr:hypothetical protein E4U43_004540 [Claviceps pusilla]
MDSQIQQMNAQIQQMAAQHQQMNAQIQQMAAQHQQMTVELRAIQKRLDGHDRMFEALGARFDGLERKVDVGFKNASARHHNGGVTSDSTPLTPMYDVQNGELISDFPADLNELDALEVGRLDSLLRQVGEVPEDREDDKRMQLMAAIGILQRDQPLSLSHRSS